jgi:hypothetical protein
VTTAVQQLLQTFDALTEHEKQEAAAELLRRFLPGVSGELPDEALIEAADELFRELDARG